MGAPEKEVRGLKKFFRRGSGSKNGHSSDSEAGAVSEQPNSVTFGNAESSAITNSALKKAKRGSFMNILKSNKTSSSQSQQPSQPIHGNSNASTNPTNSNSSGASAHIVLPSITQNSSRNSHAEMATIVLPHTPLADDPNGLDSAGHLQPRIWEKEIAEQLPPADIIHFKQLIKERDGFCRRVDSYDGHVLHVDGHAAYELGNYLGGGVAGVVYEGHRLRPMEEYPVRLGRQDVLSGQFTSYNRSQGSLLKNGDVVVSVPTPVKSIHFLCGDSNSVNENVKEFDYTPDRVSSLLTLDEETIAAQSLPTLHTQCQPPAPDENMMALEATASQDNTIMIDTVDAPSRSKHYAQAVAMNIDSEFASDASFTNCIMEETVAIKVLNPVGFRTLGPEITNTAVVARKGDPLEPGVAKGQKPMEERHVWWLVNPNSRNLRTLQRYSLDQAAARHVQVDRGAPEKGLRISLIAAYQDTESNEIKELPLTRCIEIWGHVPFGATDVEFKQIMMAVDRVNQGLPPPPIPLFQHYFNGAPPNGGGGSMVGGSLRGAPGRVGTEVTDSTMSIGSMSMEDYPVAAKRTGIYRAATSERKTVFCAELHAYIALPAVPSKYIKWLRQRRAATKEIRNMMHIGRHRNVVHLFEVLEFIQENKSTMFLILELVRGGELFDLISTNAAKITSHDKVPAGFTESETVMRKFFRELACGVHYCHVNGIAHRDLKPENLLVHNGRDGDCTLKIADFGLSAAFGPNSVINNSDGDTAIESMAPGGGSIATMPPPGAARKDTSSLASVAPATTSLSNPIKERFDRLFFASGNAISSFLSCGIMEDIINCKPRGNDIDDAPAPLRRMTSVVGSPHYVAPEIISQTGSKRNNNKGKDAAIPGPAGQACGYDGTKADVWSAGVILYAMLFRSLPFGEDLLRCPRFQSFKKWYDEAKKTGGRRSTVTAPLNPDITETDLRDFLGPHWFFPSQSSPESRDLIVYMLNPDPDARPSIQLILQHPWLLKKAL